MDDACILAIDQGTTNTKVILVDAAGRIVAQAARPLSVRYPQPAWVEQDAHEIWRSVQEAASECLEHAGGRRPAAIGISNQRETTLLWERATGKPLGPAVVWQCQRAAPLCRELAARGHEPLLRARTGLTIDPMFSAGKARWLLDSVADGRARAERGDLCLGTVDSWLLWNLTGGAAHACDMTNASRTQLFNIHTLAWDEELAELFGVPLAALPEVRPSGAFFGRTVPLAGVPGGVPVAGMIGDSHAALFGHGVFAPGVVKATYGTGSSLMAPTAAPVLSRHGLSTTIAWAREQVTYALEGNIYATGAAVQWLAQLLSLPDGAAGVERLAAQVPDAGGAYLVPAFVGLGAPHWNDAARGLIAGLVGGTTAAHLARATIESIAYQIRDVFDALAADLGAVPEALLADGGASRNDLLMQFQADIIGRPVARSASAELSALGVAWLAGLTVGLWGSEDAVRALRPAGERFAPRLPAGERERLYAGWRQAIARATLDTGRPTRP
ncbi:MAG TPA: glycerol kinase [Roseiflexaceae bacterium]|nr:glycerol kinase [Roseiflexaceae bacterium]